MSSENNWCVIRLAEFERPDAPASTRLQQLFQHIRNLFPKADETSDDEEQSDFPGYREFDLKPGADALDAAFDEWRSESEPGIKFLISPPFSGTAAIAREWAQRHNWNQLTPPAEEQLNSVDVDSWWQAQSTEQWLIDDLANYWQRRTDGMAFVRTLLPKLMRGELGQGLVVCDSWSFAFLQRAWPVNLPNVYCFAAAEEALLHQVGIRAEDKQLKALAARAFGNVGLALALWAVQQDEGHDLPSMPPDCGDETAFVLYTLLLHMGLSGETLQRLLPTVAADQLDVQLLQLQQARLIHYDDNQWHVTVYGYLAVRDFLKSRGFYVDAF
ncbi:hypothetical protein [Pseudidiomarina andamanensis]|uniref:Uncharacterized protein n=1 Tax=Pseudidiomarina andamanensis TaxID=1940690 RepID=A0AA92ET10_9GAMM|nr:hypothetical protein [Pseudidiomarina andamanensis]MDS0219443.1 hypothetical protein [Pseudidiomarina andamanensis]QGT96162.1 hypothetical protein D3795_08330 [Pseudidiomarina andamanensis]